MKIFYLFLALLQLSPAALGIPFESEGVYKISGRVIDVEGNPLPGAVVLVSNTMLGTSTTIGGSYSLSIRRVGEYKITASFMGFKSEEIELYIDSDTTLDFTLSPESIMGEAVVVSATRASSKMPIAQTNINADELERQKSGFDIPYLLELIPSVVAVSEGGTGIGNTSLRIRGTDMTRINITVNGIPLNDPESQGVWWVNMPDFVNSVDNIQVQRGVGTSTQGAGAFGATVNFQTLTLNPEPFAISEMMAGSFNTLKTSVRAGTGLINNRFSFETRYSKVVSDGYIERGWSNHQSFFFTGAWHTESSLLRFNIIHGEQHTGITWEGNPGYMLDSIRTYNPAGYMGKDDDNNPVFYPNESDNYTQTHYQLLFSRQISSKISLNLSGYWVDGEGYYEQFKRNHRLANYGVNPVTIGDTTISRTDLVRQKWLDNDLLGFTYFLSYKTGSLNASMGGGWNRYNNDHFGKLLWTKVNAGIPKDFEWYRNNGVKEDFNFFIKSVYEVIENLSLFGDLQYRSINYKLSGNDDDLASLDQTHKWDFFNPKAGLFYQISPFQETYISIGIAHREPSRADIKDAMKYGTKQTPTHEQLINYEFGYTLKRQDFAFGANLYHMDYKDQLVLTGELSDVGYSLMTNVDRSWRTGVELMAGYMPTSWLRWDGNVTLSQNKIKDFVEHVDIYDYNWNFLGQLSNELGNTNISFSPPVIGSSVFRLTPLKNFDISIISKYVGAQFIDNTSNPNRKLDAYLVNNLKFDYKINVKGIEWIKMQLMINNILKEEHEANAWVWRALIGRVDSKYTPYREDGYFPQAGINFMGRIVLEF